MANITPIQPSTSGTSLGYAAASAGGDVILNAAGASLLARNAGGSSITVTFTGVVTCSQGSLHNKAVTVPVGDTEIRIPSYCIDPTTGSAAVGYSAVTSVTVAASIG